jgi:hypothetical protein
VNTLHASLKSLRAVPICPVYVPGISVLSDISLVTKFKDLIISLLFTTV